MDRVDVTIRADDFQEKLEKLKTIYNIATNSKLIQHIVMLELQKHNIK